MEKYGIPKPQDC